jgi:hypothetical protein
VTARGRCSPAFRLGPAMQTAVGDWLPGIVVRRT